MGINAPRFPGYESINWKDDQECNQRKSVSSIKILGSHEGEKMPDKFMKSILREIWYGLKGWITVKIKG